MAETRAGKYGRNLAIWIERTILQIPESAREDYKRQFFDELRKYSFERRRSGEPKNKGCNHELSDIIEINFNDPIHFARLVKEGIHLMYQKQTSARVLKAVFDYF